MINFHFCILWDRSRFLEIFQLFCQIQYLTCLQRDDLENLKNFKLQTNTFPWIPPRIPPKIHGLSAALNGRINSQISL